MQEDVAGLEKQMADLEFKRMFNQPADPNNCFIDITAGAGGTEAEDWAGMLFRMYSRYAERKGFKIEILEKTTVKSRASTAPPSCVGRRIRLRFAAHGNRRSPLGALLAV